MKQESVCELWNPHSSPSQSNLFILLAWVTDNLVFWLLKKCIKAGQTGCRQNHAAQEVQAVCEDKNYLFLSFSGLASVFSLLCHCFDWPGSFPLNVFLGGNMHRWGQPDVRWVIWECDWNLHDTLREVAQFRSVNIWVDIRGEMWI